jgi:dienelactone hydrolase
MQTRTLDYQDGTMSLSGLLVHDDKPVTKRPGIVLFPDARGIGEHATDCARRLAMLGFVTLVADLYGNGAHAQDMAQAWELMGNLRSDCFGGTTALELARGGAALLGTVSFHGGLSSPQPDDARNIRGKVLICHGAMDTLVPLAQVAAFEEQMSKTNVDWQVCIYGGAMHAFTNPTADVEGMAYHAAADRRSWNAMLALFEEVF